MTKVSCISKYAFLMLFRQRVWLIVLFYLLFLPALTASVATILTETYLQTTLYLGISLMTLFSVIITIYFASTSIGREIKNHTIINLLSKPIRWHHIVIGKYLASILFTISVLLAMTLILAGLVSLTNPVLPDNFVMFLSQQFDLVVLHMLLLTAVCMVFNALTNSSLIALTLSALTYLIGIYGNILQELPRLIKNPVGIKFAQFLIYIVPNFSLFSLSQEVTKATNQQWHYLGELAVYTLSYSFFAVTAATLILQCRRLK